MYQDYPNVDIPDVNFGDLDPLLDGCRTAAWLDDQKFAPLQWVVPGLIPEGMSMLIGGPKIGKSWLSLGIALATAAGGKALQRVNVGTARPVLLLALEDGDRRLQDRMRRLMRGEPLPQRLNYMTRIQPGMIVATIEAWLKTIPTEAGAPLVIVDTLGKVMPIASPGESAYQRDYRVAGRLKQIADDRPGMALVVLHHDRKMLSDDFVDSVSGTNGIAGAADTIIVIQRARTEDTGLFKVTGRDVTEREYAVSTDAGVWTLLGDDLDAAAREAEQHRATANLGDRSASVVRYVNEHPEGVRAADVAQYLDIDPDQAKVYLAREHKAHRIAKQERGLYTPVTSVTSVTSPDESNSRNTSNTGTTGRLCLICEQPITLDGEDIHPTCDWSDYNHDQFENALAAARQDGDLSHANVRHHLTEETK